MKFVDGGGNVLLAAGPNPGEAIRKVATEFGFEFDADKTKVIDHHNFDAKLVRYFMRNLFKLLKYGIKDDNSHTTLSIQPETINYEIITGEKSKMNPVIYRGVALTAESQNPLRLTLMTASASAYSFDPNSPINEVIILMTKEIFLSKFDYLVPCCRWEIYHSDWSSAGS
jgi:oligosaccharyltransferase complex subunit beta